MTHSEDETPTNGPAKPLLALHRISKAFGAVQALKDVSLELRSNEVLALLGDNGAGKSTLVKILAGVHSPDAGVIEINGQAVSISNPADSRRHGLAIIFQDLALCENLDVVANLFLGQAQGRLLLAEESMERKSWELLRSLSAKIPSVRTTIASLSGGQRQTVAIARSLLGDPPVIVLDEPTAALGVAQSAEVLKMIRRLSEAGHGVIVITHNLADVRAVADRAIVLRLGRNNGVFDVHKVPAEAIVAAITGANEQSASAPTSPAVVDIS
ncbi:MAG: ATP-binding cassette domain-containing protein [Acidimicrobiales bacterium]